PCGLIQFVSGEQERLIDRQLAPFELDVHRAGVWAPVLVFDSIDGFGFVRTLVVDVRNAVVVVVRIGAPILVHEPIHVFGFIGTLVVLIGHAVAVVIRIGAPVLVLKAILVFGLVRAFVLDVRDAVAIRVDHVDRATVVREPAFVILGRVWTGVLDV